MLGNPVIRCQPDGRWSLSPICQSGLALSFVTYLLKTSRHKNYKLNYSFLFLIWNKRHYGPNTTNYQLWHPTTYCQWWCSSWFDSDWGFCSLLLQTRLWNSWQFFSDLSRLWPLDSSSTLPADSHRHWLWTTASNCQWWCSIWHNQTRCNCLLLLSCWLYIGWQCSNHLSTIFKPLDNSSNLSSRLWPASIGCQWSATILSHSFRFDSLLHLWKWIRSQWKQQNPMPSQWTMDSATVLQWYEFF